MSKAPSAAPSRNYVVIATWDELDQQTQDSVGQFFLDQVFPVLTPLAVDPVHPFPAISGLALNLAVVVRNPDTAKEYFARVKVPPGLRRFVPLGGERYLPLEELISAQLPLLFAGADLVETSMFRITRADRSALPSGTQVRLQVASTMSDHILGLLVRGLGIAMDAVDRVTSLLDAAELPVR